MDYNSLYQLLRTANPPLDGDHEAVRLFDSNHMTVENISLCPEQQKSVLHLRPSKYHQC